MCGKKRRGARLCAALFSLSGLILLAGAAQPACADANPVWVTGKVVDAQGRPVVHALVAVYDDKNKVVDYARTDEKGEYALAVPKTVLHIQKQSKGFFTEVFGTLTRFVGGAADFVNRPLRVGVQALTATQAASTINPITRAGVAAGGAAADQILFRMRPPQQRPSIEEERRQPGALVIKAVSEDSHDVVSVAKVYWVQQEVFRAGGKETRTVAAWLDPIQLAPADSKNTSHIGSDYLYFTGARLQPSIAEPGQTVRISAVLPAPPTPPVYVNVIARNSRTGQVWELKPVGNDRYEGAFEVDKRFPTDDQVISILAYAAQPNTPGRRPEVERALEGAGLWDIRKPFRYNPLVVVSRNRADLTLTVVKSNAR
jgi:hypothetical protein